MTIFQSLNDPQIADILNAGGVGVLRTDTLYGIVANADNKSAVQRVYELKGRDETKSPIVLISSSDQLFDQPDETLKAYVDSVWPGPVSIIFPSTKAPLWIRRGNDSVACRLPDDADLQNLVTATGPLIAPSANPEGQAPAMDITEAQDYFGDSVDFYVDGGRVIDASPSQLIRVHIDGTIERLR